MRKPTHLDSEDPVVTRITELLLSQKKQQKELLDHLGLSHSTYGDWKRGQSRSYRQYVDRISEYLNVSPAYLLRGDNSDNTEFENEFLATLRELTKEQQQKLLLFAQSMGGKR